MENWRAIDGCDGYEVSDLGRVRALEREVPHWRGGTRTMRQRVLALNRASNGYLTVKLNRAPHTRCVHILVLEGFRGPRPDGFVGCHNDSNKGNNALSNLRWGSVLSNTIDMLRQPTRRAGVVLREEHIRPIRQDGRIARLIAADYGVSRATIQAIRSRRLWYWVD